MRLKVNNKTISNNRANDTVRAPLAAKVATTPGRLEHFEKEWKVETQSRLHTLHHNYCTRADIAKAKIIAGLPNEILADIEGILRFLEQNKHLY